MFNTCFCSLLHRLSNNLILVFFFVKQKTAYEMRISDWSSDVCSSDLQHGPDLDGLAFLDPDFAERAGGGGVDLESHLVGLELAERVIDLDRIPGDRKSVV